MIRDLDKLRAIGHDPADLLATAVTRGWRTVFAPQHRSSGDYEARQRKDRVSSQLIVAAVLTGAARPAQPLADVEVIDGSV